VQNVVILFSLLGIIAGGVSLIVLTNFSKMRVSPESLWNRGGENLKIPQLPSTSVFNEDEWYKLTSGF